MKRIKITKKIFFKIKKRIQNKFLFLEKIKVANDVKRIQENYSKIFPELENKIKSGKQKVKVAFIVSENSKWSNQSVYDAFEEDDLFEPFILVIPRFKEDMQPEKLQENYEFFYNKKMKVFKAYDEEKNEFIDLQEFSPDIVFLEQLLSDAFRKKIPTAKYIYPDIISKFALTCYVTYGFIVSNCYQNIIFNSYISKVWKYFAETDYHKNQLLRQTFLKDQNIVVSGYPKMDVYFDNDGGKSQDIWKLPKNEHIKRIIWAPHWSIGSDICCFGTFDKNYKFFLELARQNKNIEWVLKPHPKLFSFITIEKNFLTQEQVEDYIKSWNNLPNGQIYDKGDYFDLFRTSDAMITDSGSFRLEYLPTQKPLLFLVNSHGLEYLNSFTREITDSLYTAYNTEDIADFIENTVVSGNDPLKSRRLQIINEKNILPHRRAGLLIKDNLKFLDSIPIEPDSH